jgi:hypothetical protein
VPYKNHLPDHLHHRRLVVLSVVPVAVLAANWAKQQVVRLAETLVVLKLEIGSVPLEFVVQDSSSVVMLRKVELGSVMVDV